MANNSIHPQVIQSILRLYRNGKSNRFISTNLGISRNTVSRYIDQAIVSGYSLDELLSMNVDVLYGYYFPENSISDQEKQLINFFLEQGKIKPKHEYKMELWRKYSKCYPGGYSQTQFNHHLSKWCYKNFNFPFTINL